MTLYSMTTHEHITSQGIGARQRASLWQTLAAGAGFALSSGWYFPGMLQLWLDEELYVAPSGDPFSLFEKVLLFLTIKTVAIIAFGFLLRNSALDVLYRVGDNLVEKPFYERIALLSPLLILQLFACVILFPLMHPNGRSDLIISLAPLFLGTSEIIFALLWVSALACLPGVRSCYAYGFGALCGLGLYMSMIYLPPFTAHLVRGLSPLLACPLLFFAAPGSATIKSYRFKYDFLRAASNDPALAASAPPPSPYALLIIFAVSGSLQILLTPVESGFNTSLLHNHFLPKEAALSFVAQACGAFLTGMLLQQRRYFWLPAAALASFGGCAILLPLLGIPATLAVPTAGFHFSAGIGSAFAAFLLSAIVRSGRPLVSSVCGGLFLFSLLSYLGGYLLWAASLLFRRDIFTPEQAYMQLAGLAALLCVPLFYTLRLPLHRTLFATAPSPELVEPLPAEKPLPLTKRETEIARMVQAGMKNLEISTQLNIAETTLRVHLRSIYRKLGVRGRPNLSSVDLGAPPEDPFTEDGMEREGGLN